MYRNALVRFSRGVRLYSQAATAVESSAVQKKAGTKSAAEAEAVKKPKSFDDFVDSLVTNAAASFTVTERSKPLHRIDNVTTIDELFKLVDNISGAEAALALKRAVSLKANSDQLQSVAERLSKLPISSTSLSDDFTVLAVMIKNGVEGDAMSGFEKRIEAKANDNTDVIGAIAYIAAIDGQKRDISTEVKAILEKILKDNLSTMKSADLLSVLRHWRGSPQFTKDAIDQIGSMLAVLSLPELCSLFASLAEMRQRDITLLRNIVQQISLSKAVMTPNQIMAVATASSSINFLDGRLQRRMATDILKDINRLEDWDDISAIINSFCRLRIGDEKVWTELAKWVDAHLEKASIKNLGRILYGFVMIGMEPALLQRSAKAFASRTNFRTIPSTQTVLINVYTLAYCKVLTPELAEMVLSRPFYSELFKNEDGKKPLSSSEKLYRALRLLQISACAQQEVAGYKGTIVTKKMLEEFVKFDDEAVQEAQVMKYGKKTVTDNQTKFFGPVLSMIAPRRTHLGPPTVTDEGFFVDAQMKKNPKSAQLELLPVAKWKESQAPAQPLLYFAWNGIKTCMPDDLRLSSEKRLLGRDRLALRLLSKQRPIVIFHDEISQLQPAEALQFLKERIVKTV